MTITYRHCGSLGDIIYSLSLFSKIQPGEFLVALNSCQKVAERDYGYPPITEAKMAVHKQSVTKELFDMLKPLLAVQPYITGVSSRKANEPDPLGTVVLDDFRHIFGRSYRANYVRTYFKTFGLECNPIDYQTPWIQNIIPRPVKQIVCTRTDRYHSPDAEVVYRGYANKLQLNRRGVFLGTPEEHAAFQEMIQMDIMYRPVQDFLEMAQIIKGAQCYLGNQTFAYSLAYGMGVKTILETRKDILLKLNECYFVKEHTTYF